MKKNILLLSGSNVHGSGYLDPFESVIKDFFATVEEILFIPYAAHESQWDNYTDKVRQRFALFGIKVSGIHQQQAGKENKINNYQGIFIGGGNTFRLLQKLQQFDLLSSIKNAVLNNGVLYMGSSAGSNVACKTISTTNDMPIVFPSKGFDAIQLVSFQLNPHYIDPDPNSTHMGETRAQRILEYHENNSIPVIGLREGAWLLINDEYYEDQKIYLGGSNGAKFFFPSREPLDIPSPRNFRLGSNQLILE